MVPINEQGTARFAHKRRPSDASESIRGYRQDDEEQAMQRWAKLHEQGDARDWQG